MKRYALFLMLSLSLVSPAMVQAQVQAQTSDKQRVISHVKQSYQGRALSADVVKDSSQYRVKILQPDGRVKVIRVDARKLVKERR